jgi:hypothetical protein
MVAMAITPIPIIAVALSALLNTGKTILGVIKNWAAPIFETSTIPMGMATIYPKMRARRIGSMR